MGFKIVKRYRLLVSIDPNMCIGCGRCVKACLTNALTIVNGKAKLIDEKRCDGFGSCIAACPFGIPELLPIGHTIKCDLCKKLRAQNLEPGCIATCPSNAIIWGSPEKITRSMREKALKRISNAYTLLASQQ